MKQKLSSIMLAGTGSDVGKSLLVAGLCRIFKQDGYLPAPFKAQNMALNSYATPDGFEIGRAQAVQAEAAGIPCSTDMNPLLLKPMDNYTSQVVLNGKPAGNRDAYHYFRTEGREYLRRAVANAFHRLELQYNPIVLEGAGSISELNLKDTDIVNMSMAIEAGADVILVADIDRGGVFASVYGSVMLQNEDDRKRIKGIIVNKFRGDMRLFENGRRLMQEICGVPVIGVVPYFKDIHIEEEDSMSLCGKRSAAGKGKINVAVVMLPHISNFTDFNRLERTPGVHLYYTDDADEISKAQIILLPGSKSTIADLYEIRRSGVAASIFDAVAHGASVIGICGGYQMMGGEVLDPDGVEGGVARYPGLGLLPVTTVIRKEKVTRQVRFRFLDCEEDCVGYEIHMGETSIADASGMSLNTLSDGSLDGCYVSERCFGSYIHGILDNDVVIRKILLPYADMPSDSGVPDYAAYRQEQYDKLASELRKYLDIPLIYSIMSRDK